MTDITKQVQELLAKIASGQRAKTETETDTAAVSQPYDYAKDATPPEGEPDFGYKGPEITENVRVLSLDEARAMFGDDFLAKLFGGAAPDRFVPAPGLPSSLDAPDADLAQVFQRILSEAGPSSGCDIVDVLEEVHEEVHRARKKHPPQNSPHEGYAVLKEEVEELWDEIKADNGRSPSARKEAIQIAAMAIRYILDNIDNQTQEDDGDDEIAVTLG